MSNYRRIPADILNLMKVFIKHPQMVRGVILTENQACLVEYIRDEEMGATASMVSDWQGCSIQSASTKLTRLWYRGYLNRIEELDPTGGIRYVYKSNV